MAGLYLEVKNSDENTIMRSRELKSIEMQFVRSIGAKKMRESFLKSIQRNCRINCEPLFETVKKLGVRLPDIKPGDRMTYLFDSEKVRILFNNDEKGVINGWDNVSVVLSSFIGPKPPDLEMKLGLLGRDP